MKKTILFAAIALTLATIVGCKKEETISNTTSSCKFEKATFIGKWKITKIQNKTTGKDITTEFFTANPCEKTNITEFKSTGILATIATSSCMGQEYLTWSLVTDSSFNYLQINDTSANQIITKDVTNIVNCNTFEVISTKSEEKYTLTKQ